MIFAMLLSFFARSFLALGETWEDGAPAGHYESYIFALEWQPAWSQPPTCETNLAAHLSPSAYAATHLSVHGLWPNYDPTLHGGRSWPQFCIRASGEAFTECEADYGAEGYCTPTAAAEALNYTNATTTAATRGRGQGGGGVLANTTSVMDLGWQDYALEYAYGELAAHEWSKHGSCTNFTDLEYFEQVGALYGRLAGGRGAAAVAEAAASGAPVARLALEAAFAQDTGGKRVAFNCLPPGPPPGEGGGLGGAQGTAAFSTAAAAAACVLTEVWTAWDLDPSTLRPTSPRDYGAEGEPCPSQCAAFVVPAWTNDDGACPPEAAASVSRQIS